MSQTGVHNSFRLHPGEHLLTQTPRLLFLKNNFPVAGAWRALWGQGTLDPPTHFCLECVA